MKENPLPFGIVLASDHSLCRGDKFTVRVRRAQWAAVQVLFASHPSPVALEGLAAAIWPGGPFSAAATSRIICDARATLSRIGVGIGREGNSYVLVDLLVSEAAPMPPVARVREDVISRTVGDVCVTLPRVRWMERRAP